MGSARAWQLVAAIAAVVTVGCSAFAVAAAVTSEDGGPAAGTSGESPAAGAGQQIAIKDFAFDPPNLSVPVGSTVTWTNDDDTTHTVRQPDGGVIDSPELDHGDTYSVTFDEPGTYDYICTIHTRMTGTVTVTE
jgi:amicyanin